MNGTYLHVGLQLTYSNHRCEIVSRLQTGEFDIHNAQLNVHYHYSFIEILELIVEGEIVLHPKEKPKKERLPYDLSDLSDKQYAKLKRRLHYVKAALKKGYYSDSELLAELIDEYKEVIGDKSPPSAISLYRWNKAYRESEGSVFSIVDKNWSKVDAHYRFKGDLLNFIIDTSELYIEEKMSPNVSRVYWEVDHAIREENKKRPKKNQWPIPSRRQFYRLYDRHVDNYLKIKAKKGEVYANNYFSVSRKFRPERRPLSRVEIDHTQRDIIVIDVRFGIILGRPTFTVGMDRFSTAPWGLYIGWEKPSTSTVLQCMMNGILPKTYVKKDFPKIRNDWAVCGFPQIIFVDRGPEFVSKSMLDVYESLGIGLQLQPKHMPHLKGTVERFIGEIVSKVDHVQPGTTLNNTLKLHYGYDPQKHAIVTLDELRYKSHRYLIDFYMQNTKENTIGMSPNDKWMLGVKNFPPMLPHKQLDFTVLFNHVTFRQIGPEGIRLHGNLAYDSEELKTLARRKRFKEMVKVKYNPANIAFIWVYDKYEHRSIIVPSNDLDYTNKLPLKIHKQIRQIALDRKNSDDIGALSEVLHELQISMHETMDKYINPPKKKDLNFFKKMHGLPAPESTDSDQYPEDSIEEEYKYHENDIPEAPIETINTEKESDMTSNRDINEEGKKSRISYDLPIGTKVV